MKLVLVADAGRPVGLGHLSRALAVAEEALARGWDVQLVGALSPPGPSLVEAVPSLEWIPTASLPQTLEAARGADIVHVDSYDESFDSVRVSDALMSSMADGSFGLRPADVVIDSSPSAMGHAAQVAGSGARRLLAGPDYVPLRRNVMMRAGLWAPHMALLPSVLLVLGGSDPAGLTLPTLRQIADLDVPLDLTVVAHRALHKDLQAAWKPARGRLRVESFARDLMARAVRHDMTISAAGTSVWELAHVGAPMALLCVAPNQKDNYLTLTGADCAVPLSNANSWEAFRSVVADAGRLAELSSNASCLVDGRGAWRILSSWEALLATEPTPVGPGSATTDIRVRPATPDDAEVLLSWRNDQTTVQNSRVAAPVEMPEHRRWLQDTLTRPDRQLLIAERESVPIATVRWDRTSGPPWEERWEVSITVAPEQRGSRLALPVLTAGEEWLRSDRNTHLRALASVHEANLASIRLFKAAGCDPSVDAHHRSVT